MRLPVLAAAAGLFILAGCGSPAPSTTLTVSGPAPVVERFVQTQTGRHPGLTVAERSEAVSGQSSVTLRVTQPTTTQDLAEISKEAIAARLGVRLKSGR